MNQNEVVALVERKTLGLGTMNEPMQLAIDGLSLFKQTECSTFTALTYEPVLCLILQGRKETVIGDRTVQYGNGDILIVTHDVPVTSRVIEASPEKPYLAIVLKIDLATIRMLSERIPNPDTLENSGKSMNVSAADEALIDAFGRYMALADNPNEAANLGPLVKQEIHYRVLTAPHGYMLRRLQHPESHASRIRQAVSAIRESYKSEVVIADLANTAGMSISSFHEHFKAVTETTPIQYQKHLRLMEAKRLLLEGSQSVSATAFAVGYESFNQFSREYTRKFGISPRNDLNK